MKILPTLFRAGVSLLIAFLVSFWLAMAVFDYSSRNLTDRVSLVLIPTFSIAWLIFKVIPSLGQKSSQFRESHSIGMYAIGFLLTLILTSAAVGFFREAIRTPLNLILFTAGLALAGSVAGYILVRRVAKSLKNGFLNKPLNFLLSLSLPVFLLAFLVAVLQFPVMFTLDDITVPAEWRGWFIVAALISGLVGITALLQFETRWLSQFKQTRLFSFLDENLPGVYAGGMFFLINLVIARALNHPALTVNSVLFESDAGPWLSILGSPTEDVINRSVHPLVLITLRPLVRFVTLFTADQWQLAPILVVAAMSGLCVFMAWFFVKRAASQPTYAFIFAVMLGSTAAHLVFGSLTDTYIFGATSLIFFLLLIQARETRFSILVPAGLLVFGVTITNIAQSVIGLLFNRFGFKRLIRYGLTLAAAAVTLTFVTSALFPNRQTLFFVPGDIAFEGNFVKPVRESAVESLKRKAEVVSRTMLLYGVAAPKPLEVTADKPPHPTIDLKTYDVRTDKLASYKGLGNLPLALWLILLAGSFVFLIKGWRTSPRLPLILGLLGSLAFNFFLHMNYGTELFLYSIFWTYALVFFVALALADFAGKTWFETALAIFLLILMTNNFWFIFTILRALAPFYASI
ncbi:MAG: hypothetical protein HY865_13640 [Chloroflexi bacterium]|nr:hypothetical protein [Chloroflexota bacterium]